MFTAKFAKHAKENGVNTRSNPLGGSMIQVSPDEPDQRLSGTRELIIPLDSILD